MEIDEEMGNTLWFDAIQKEMHNVYIAFDLQESGTEAPPGYKWIPHDMVFDLKMDFTHKARLVAGGHKTDPPMQLTYSSVVSRESVWIALLMAALHDVDLLAADIGNAYLNMKTQEKVYIITGPKFVPLNHNRVAIIVWVLYGLKSSGTMRSPHFANMLRDLGFTSSLGDQDVWIWAATKENSFNYYKYILVYIDDLLVISHQAKRILESLETDYDYHLKDVGPPKWYLGATIGKYDGLCQQNNILTRHYQ